MKRPVVRTSALVVAIALLAACNATAEPTGSTVGPTEPPSADPIANGPNPPPGEGVRFDKATLSPDLTALFLDFVGGKEFDPKDSCSSHYFGWAREVAGVLEAKIVDDTPAAAVAPVACSAVGFGRHVTINLAQPFHGSRVHDAAGYVHFVRAPDGVVELRKVPPNWALVRQDDVEESPTGRWWQQWTLGGQPPGQGSKGKIDLYQAFDGPAGVTGGEETRTVKVNGSNATLYRFAPDGELVLVWQLGKDGLALVVNEADFPVDKAIELAESAAIP